MKKSYGVLAMTTVVFSLGFCACSSDSDQPGNQAGYADDGSGNCSQNLVDDYDDIAQGLDGVESLMSVQSTMGGTVEQQEIQTELSDINTVAAELSAFQSNYGSISCTAVSLSDGSSTTIDQAKMDSISNSVATIQQDLNAENAEPVGGVAQCAQSPMFTDNLTISAELDQIQKSVGAAEANANAQQKKQSLQSAQTQLLSVNALISAYNQNYAGAYCDLNGVGTITSSSLSGPETTQASQLSQLITQDLAGL